MQVRADHPPLVETAPAVTPGEFSGEQESKEAVKIGHAQPKEVPFGVFPNPARTGYSGAFRSHIPRQTDQAFRGMPISDSEVKPIRNLRLSDDLMGTSESMGERGSALDKPRAGRAPLEGGGAHTIGPTEDVHAENERNPTTALSWIEAAPDCPKLLPRTKHRKCMS